MKMICLRASKHYIFTREQLESLGASAYCKFCPLIIFIVRQLVCIMLRFKLILASETERVWRVQLCLAKAGGVFEYFVTFIPCSEIRHRVFCGGLLIFVNLKLALFQLSGTISQLRSPKNLLLELYVKHVRYLAISEQT